MKMNSNSTYYVYAIRSKVDGRIYVGFTIDLKIRIKEHNGGKTKSTKGFTPWEIKYFEKVTTRQKAR